MGHEPPYAHGKIIRKKNKNIHWKLKWEPQLYAYNTHHFSYPLRVYEELL